MDSADRAAEGANSTSPTYTLILRQTVQTLLADAGVRSIKFGDGF
jgi:hypothetical protein